MLNTKKFHSLCNFIFSVSGKGFYLINSDGESAGSSALSKLNLLRRVGGGLNCGYLVETWAKSVETWWDSVDSVAFLGAFLHVLAWLKLFKIQSQ
jgi:hypothetical protein